MPRVKSDSIRALGLRTFINTRHAYLAPEFGMEPYEKLVEMLTSGRTDTEIAHKFERKHPQTASGWRVIWLEENDK